MTSYPNRRSSRLQGYDYATAGIYFLTLVVEHRLPLLGEIVDRGVVLSPAGHMVAKIWGGLDRYYPVGVDAFVVMPNHLHGIVVLPDAGPSGTHREDRAAVPTGASRGAGGMSVSTVIQRFKTFTMHEYGVGVRENGWPRYRGRLWQNRFYDRVIRNERELAAIREYIMHNPLQWALDRENPDRYR